MYAIIIFIAFAYICNVKAEEFLYPVAVCNKEEQVCVYMLYQKSINHIELWQWDPSTKKANKALLSSFTPGALRILPDNAGFSFIDNGRIKIKSFNKRSPKSLDIYEPIYDLGVVEWIDSHWCYFSAKKQGRQAIFQLSILAQLHEIIGEPDRDCIYPQKVGYSLFFIERTEGHDGNRYAIMRIPFPKIAFDQTNNFNNTENFDARVKKLLEESEQSPHKVKDTVTFEKQLIADFQDQALAFLHMISESEGYVLEHPTNIDKQDKTIVMTYYQLKKEMAQWKRNYLFSFEIPLHLLLPGSSSRLYESILPLLPLHYNNFVFYINCSNSKEYYNLNIYSFNLISGEHQQLSHGSMLGQNFCAPLIIGNRLYCGGCLCLDNALPCMKIDEDGSMCFELPYFVF